MPYFGDIRLGDTIDIKFCTVTTTGAPTALSSGTVVAYPGNSTTEVTAGITLTADFDTRTGLNNVRVVATSGNGYATATNYSLVLSAGTVGGTSVVGYTVGDFSIENRSALMPTTAARTLVVDAAGLADANMVKAGPTGSGTAQTAGDIPGKTNSLTFTGANKVDASVRDWVGDTIPARSTTGVPKVDVQNWTGTAVTTPDTAGSPKVTITTGTGAGQLDFTSGVVKSDVSKWLGTAASTPTVAGVPNVNVKTLNDVATTSVTTINANVGTTQPVNFTGTGASALAKSDMVDVAGAAVSTSTVQIGTNVVSFTAGAITDAAFAAGTGKKVIRANTAAAGAASTITLDAAASATDSIYNGLLIYLTSGTGSGQVRTITAYVGATQVATVDRAWQTNPDATSTFALIPDDSAKVDSSLQVTAASVQGNVTGSVGSVTGSVGSVTGLTASDVGAIKTKTDSLTFTVAGQVDSNVLDWKSATAPAMTGDAFARLGAPVGPSISADIAGVQSDTDNIQTRIPTALDANGFIKADVEAFKAGLIATPNVTGVPKVDVVDWAGTTTTLSTGLPDVNTKTITTAAIASGSFSANAIDSAALATSAANEVRDAILSDSTPFAGAKVNNLPEGMKINTALANFEFFMADSADHVTGKTGLTVAGAVSIDGAAFVALTNTPATEVANGIYKINLAQADTNGTVLTFKFTSAGADATFITVKTSA